MALFKILKGNKSNLDKLKKTEGYCYFIKDENKLYVDVDSNTRVPLDAKNADQLKSGRRIRLTGAISSPGTVFDGSKDIGIEATSIDDTYIVPGSNKNLTGSVSTTAMAGLPIMCANRLSLIPKEDFLYELSRDGGATWTDPKSPTDAQIPLLTTSYSDSLRIGVGYTTLTSGEFATIQDKLRVTLIGNKIYCQVKKILLRVSTNGATGCTVLLEGQNRNSDSWKEFGTATLSGWSGWNEINCFKSNFGGQENTYNYYKLRFTFSITGVSTTYTSFFQLMGIYMFAPTAWSYPSYESQLGKDYKYIYTNNEIQCQFAHKINGTITKAWMDKNGNEIHNTYVKKADLQNASISKIMSCTGDELIAITSPTMGSIRYVSTIGTGDNKLITPGLYFYLGSWKKVALEDTAIISNEFVSGGDSTSSK